MGGGATLPQALASSELEQPEMPFVIYRGERLRRPWRPQKKGAQQRQRCGATETAKKSWRKSKQRVFDGLQNCFGGGGGDGGRRKCGEDGWKFCGSEQYSFWFIDHHPQQGSGHQDRGGEREGRYWRGIGVGDESFALRRRRQRRMRRGQTFYRIQNVNRRRNWRSLLP